MSLVHCAKAPIWTLIDYNKKIASKTKSWIKIMHTLTMYSYTKGYLTTYIHTYLFYYLLHSTIIPTIYIHKFWRWKCFIDFLKAASEELVLTSSGSWFHSLGPLTRILCCACVVRHSGILRDIGLLEVLGWLICWRPQFIGNMCNALKTNKQVWKDIMSCSFNNECL